MNFWYRRSWWVWLLWPMCMVYWVVISIKRGLYRFGLKKSCRFDVPVIVVGNITVGGAGKTPLVIALVQWLQEHGYRPGVVSRGYRSQAPQYPYFVKSDSDASVVGDEPLLIVQRCGVPLVIDANRCRAVTSLLAQTDCDVVVSDDGLQHYALGRDVEIAVVDGERGVGNGLLLPAGPLREPKSRLKSVDFVVVNGRDMQYAPGPIYHLLKPSEQLIPSGERVHAVAGIGNPEQFFQLLERLGFEVIEHAFADHHAYRATDFNFLEDNDIIIMTEKDAVKCRSFASERFWCLPISAQLSDEVFLGLRDKLQGSKIAS